MSGVRRIAVLVDSVRHRQLWPNRRLSADVPRTSAQGRTSTFGYDGQALCQTGSLTVVYGLFVPLPAFVWISGDGFLEGNFDTWPMFATEPGSPLLTSRSVDGPVSQSQCEKCEVAVEWPAGFVRDY